MSEIGLTEERTLKTKDLLWPMVIALCQMAVQIFFHGSYGYFRDELYYLACSDHLSWGYVDQPPLSIAVLALTRLLLGDSLHAIRFLPALAGGAVVVLAAMMARRLGGGRMAQAGASLTVAAAHELLGAGRTFSMNPFDVLFWALASYLLIVIFGSGRQRMWLSFGLVIGLGLLNKYSIGFLCIGLVAGLLATPLRKQFLSPWYWGGAALALLIFLPHLIWEMVNGFPSLEFMHNASQLKNVPTTPLDFLLGQIRDVNVLNAPLWLAGVGYLLFGRETQPFRPLGWMYPVVFVVMVVGNAKVYYLGPIYPMLLAAGAVVAEKFLARGRRRWIAPAYAALLGLVALLALPLTLPVLPVDNFIRYEKMAGMTPKAEERSTLGALPQYYADEFGWEEMVKKVADIYHGLAKAEQDSCVIYVRNYGEAAAIDFFGRQYGLPKALCAHNSYWYWGPGTKTGNVAIIFGHSLDAQESLENLRAAYRQVELAARTKCEYCMPFENDRSIFICRGMRTTFQNIWPRERFFI